MIDKSYLAVLNKKINKMSNVEPINNWIDSLSEEQLKLALFQTTNELYHLGQVVIGGDFGVHWEANGDPIVGNETYPDVREDVYLFQTEDGETRIFKGILEDWVYQSVNAGVLYVCRTSDFMELLPDKNWEPISEHKSSTEDA